MAIRTNKAIISTFEEMLDEMPFEKITVSELAKRCEISPNTFYYHYEDIYDLLSKWLEIKRTEWLQLDDVKASLKQFISYCKDNKGKIYHIYNSLSRNYLERMVFKYEKELIESYLKNNIDTSMYSKEKIEQMTDFVLYAIIGSFLKFMWNDMKEDTDVLVNRSVDFLEGYIKFCLNRK